MTLTYSLAEVAPYINWLYFFHAWGMSGKPEKERQRLQGEAEERLWHYAHHYQTHGVFRLFSAYSHGDDIVLDGGERLPCLRQQQAGSDYLCLSDFISPKDAPALSAHNALLSNRIGLFATTVDAGFETDFDNDPYEKMMMQLLADRLAEATAERMHEEVRKTYWGYAPDESLSVADMLAERWQGIRPAVGYPSLPDASINFLIDGLIDMRQIGIRLTESGAMRPHASVSGMMLAHSQARYFSVGKIGRDQLADYARRRGLSLEETKKYLAANL